MKIYFLKWLGYFVLTLIYKTCRFEIHGQKYFEKIKKNKKPIMLCVWHGRMLYPIFYVIKQKIKLWTIASPYKDGEIISQILKKWDFNIIKGSSNRNSKKVLQKMNQIFQSDPSAIIAITNDGPKGPRHVAKTGSLEIAQKYNAQIITITGDSNKKWIFNSWDKFYLPKPFSKIIITIAPEYKKNNDLTLSMDISEYMVKYEKIASEKI